MILGIVLLAAVAAWVVILTYWRITVPVLMALVLLLVLLEIQSKEKWANGMSRIENSKP